MLDTTREALTALAGGIDVADARLTIWGFSSLKHDRVSQTRCGTSGTRKTALTRTTPLPKSEACR